MIVKESVLYVSIGLKANAKRVITVNICIFYKKIRYLLASIFFKKDNVRKGMLVSTDMLTPLLIKGLRIVHIMIEDFVDWAYSAFFNHV